MMDLNEESLHGLHDDKWCEEMLEKHPDSIVFRGWAKPETMTEREMYLAVRITGDADIALRWARSHNDT